MDSRVTPKRFVIAVLIGAAGLLFLLASACSRRPAEAPPPPTTTAPSPPESAPPSPTSAAPPSESAPPADTAAPPAKAPPDPFASVDQTLKNLRFGNIAFNAPHAINLDDTADIQLLLGLATPIDKLKHLIVAAGEKEGGRIQVSDRMEAHLTGANFVIAAVTPEPQAVTGTDITAWRWEVTPMREGSQHLHLTLSAILVVDGVPTPRAIRTFDTNIQVEVTRRQKISALFYSNWQWLWATLLVPVAGWLWRKRGKKDSADNKSDC